VATARGYALGWRRAVSGRAPAGTADDPGGGTAAEYRHQPVQAGDPVSALGAADPALCAGQPAAARVGDAEGPRCSCPRGEQAAAAIDSGTLWLITVDGGVPDDEVDAFVASFEFG
jgi:hypothetical protein